MAPKIKNLKPKPTSKRTCGVCGKNKEMEKYQRFCSATCKSAASDIDKFGSEFRVSMGRK